MFELNYNAPLLCVFHVFLHSTKKLSLLWFGGFEVIPRLCELFGDNIASFHHILQTFA